MNISISYRKLSSKLSDKAGRTIKVSRCSSKSINLHTTQDTILFDKSFDWEFRLQKVSGNKIYFHCSSGVFSFLALRSATMDNDDIEWNGSDLVIDCSPFIPFYLPFATINDLRFDSDGVRVWFSLI